MNGMAASPGQHASAPSPGPAAASSAAAAGLSSFVSEGAGPSKAARKKASKGSVPTWQCALCTFNNKQSREQCEMCEMPNPRANDPPAPLPPKQPSPAFAAAPNGVKKGSAASVTAASVAAAAAAPLAAAPAPAPAAAAVSALPNVSASFRSLSYENGLITACNNVTYDEVMRRRLIGLPRGLYELVSKLRAKHSAIFLLNMETRDMYGVFEADGQPGLDLEPDAWAGQSYNGRRTSRFPAQCHFTIAADFESPLPERHYRDFMAGKDGQRREKIRLLSAEETKTLIKIFQTRSKLRKVNMPMLQQQQQQQSVAPVAAVAAAPVAAAPSASATAAPSALSATTSRRTSIDSTVSEEASRRANAGAVPLAATGTAAAAASSGLLGGKKVTKAQQTCKRWLADECSFDDASCKFLHVATVCRAFQRGTCPKKNCPFVHDKVDREHYRHGRSYCQKTAVHADEKPTSAAPAAASKPRPAAPKDSLDAILSGLGSWKLQNKKVEPAEEVVPQEDEEEEEEEEAGTHDDADDALAQEELDAAAEEAELDAAQQAAADEELLAQQEAADRAQDDADAARLAGFDLGEGSVFEQVSASSVSAALPASSASSSSSSGVAGALFMSDGLSFDMGGSQGGSSVVSSAAPPGSGWGASFEQAFEQPSQSQSLGGMFFEQQQQQQQQQQDAQRGGGEEEEFPWFTNFRQHVVAPALQAMHLREQQAQHRIIGPD